MSVKTGGGRGVGDEKGGHLDRAEAVEGESSEEGVVVHLYLSMYKSLRGGGENLSC